MVPLSGDKLNRELDESLGPVKDATTSLFDTLDQWNVILDGLKNPYSRLSDPCLPQSKKVGRPSPPVKRRHKKMGGAR